MNFEPVDLTPPKSFLFFFSFFYSSIFIRYSHRYWSLVRINMHPLTDSFVDTYQMIMPMYIQIWWKPLFELKRNANSSQSIKWHLVLNLSIHSKVWLYKPLAFIWILCVFFPLFGFVPFYARSVPFFFLSTFCFGATIDKCSVNVTRFHHNRTRKSCFVFFPFILLFGTGFGMRLSSLFPSSIKTLESNR